MPTMFHVNSVCAQWLVCLSRSQRAAALKVQATPARFKEISEEDEDEVCMVVKCEYCAAAQVVGCDYAV
jgi:hypothetical protein